MIGTVVPRAELSPLREEQMLSLLQAHFCGVMPPQFRRDLDQKNWVILITDQAGRLQGFSTLLCYATAVEGQQLNVVYSGDTIVTAGARADPTLARTWIQAVNRFRDEAGAKRVKGFNVYSNIWDEWGPYDSLVLAMGQRVEDALYMSLKGKVPELYRIGDCVAPRKVDMAIWEGHKLGREI